jgi:Mn2+/Fe2+ NRAMP family transporter
MLVGLAINFLGIDPIQALIYSAVANGLVAPLVLLPIVLISSRKDIMGRWTNKPLTAIIGWLVVVLMAISGGAAIWALLP